MAALFGADDAAEGETRVISSNSAHLYAQAIRRGSRPLPLIAGEIMETGRRSSLALWLCVGIVVAVVVWVVWR